MKIVQINAVARLSSTGRMVSALHDEFVAQGHESFIVACNVDNDDHHIKAANNINIKTHALYSRILGRQGFFSKKSTAHLVKKLRDIQPDVVHLHNLHGNYINLPTLFEYLANENITTVVTLHDCWFFTGHCCYFIDSQCNRWMSSCGNCPDRHKWNTSWFFDCSKKDLRAKKQLFGAIPRLGIVGVSDWVTSFVKDSILKDATIIKRIYNWIDTDTFSPRNVSDLRKKLNLENKFVVLGVSHGWSREKGMDDFISLAKELPDFSILMVGDMPSNTILPDNIISVPSTDNVDALVDYYNVGNVFFNPSIRETFGLVTAEALSCGTPVVVYNATANPELIDDSCGMVVEIGDIDGAASIIKKMANDEIRFTGCREFIIRNFQKLDRINDYLKLYNELTKNDKHL